VITLGFAIFTFGIVAVFLLWMWRNDVSNREERRELYHRIQAPKAAVDRRVADDITDEPVFVSPVDDKAFTDYASERGQ
jgi:hypothetical protein